MSNSFNISVKLDIAAAVVKIDANKSVIDNIHDTDLPAAVVKIDANKAVIDNIHDTDLPAAVVKIDANKAVIDNIHDTDLPAVDTKVTTIDTVCDNIRNIDVPNIQTNIDANETKIDTIDGIVDAIKIKTDATPQKVRGDFSLYYADTTSSSFVDVCNITGQGKLLYCVIYLANAGDTFEIKITLDAIASSALSHTGDTVRQVIIFQDNWFGADSFDLGQVALAATPGLPLDVEFSTSLQIQMRRSAGAANSVLCKASVSVDDF